jgi:hypothetical protein
LFVLCVTNAFVNHPTRHTIENNQYTLLLVPHHIGCTKKVGNVHNIYLADDVSLCFIS